MNKNKFMDNWKLVLLTATGSFGTKSSKTSTGFEISFVSLPWHVHSRLSNQRWPYQKTFLASGYGPKLHPSSEKMAKKLTWSFAIRWSICQDGAFLLQHPTGDIKLHWCSTLQTATRDTMHFQVASLAKESIKLFHFMPSTCTRPPTLNDWVSSRSSKWKPFFGRNSQALLGKQLGWSRVQISLHTTCSTRVARLSKRGYISKGDVVFFKARDDSCK